MKKWSPLEFIKWSSSVLIVLIVVWSIGLATYAIFCTDDPTVIISGIVKIDGIMLLFVLPEKGSAFFGGVVKRKQLKGGKDGCDQSSG